MALLSRVVRNGLNLDEPWVQDLLSYVDRLATEAPAASGLLRTSYHPGRARTINGEFENGPDEPGYGGCWSGPGKAQARTTADATWYLARLVALLQGDYDVTAWQQSCVAAVAGSDARPNARGPPSTNV